MISGAHTLIYSHDAEADRAFFRDVLGFDSVDSGGGWLIFALPPAELAIHPTDEKDNHELYPAVRGHRGDGKGTGAEKGPHHPAIR